MSAMRAIVVGTAFGGRVHVPALRAAGFEVVALVGSDPKRTKEKAATSEVPHAFTDLSEAIAKTRAVAVTIATPPATHAELALTAIVRGCHVICEKPLAMNVAEARKMLDAAEAAQVVHLVGHQFRWQPERALLARVIADGQIGMPRLATLIHYLSLVADPDSKMPAWWFDPASGGGWLGAHGSHYVDQIRAMLGEFASVSAALPVVSDRKVAADDTYVVRFTLRNGVQGVLQSTAGAWGPGTPMTRIAGTKGTVWEEGGVVRVADRDGVREIPLPSELQVPPPPAGAYVRLCEVFRDRIEGRASATTVREPTFADGVACMEALDAIRASAARGGALVSIS
jgi:predicted dehydrogenase